MVENLIHYRQTICVKISITEYEIGKRMTQVNNKSFITCYAQTNSTIQQAIERMTTTQFS